MLLFPEVKIKGLSADTGKHEILPQHTAPCWNHSSKPDEKAETKLTSPHGTHQGQAAQSQQHLPAGQGGGRDLCDQYLTHQKVMDTGMARLFGKR